MLNVLNIKKIFSFVDTVQFILCNKYNFEPKLFISEMLKLNIFLNLACKYCGFYNTVRYFLNNCVTSQPQLLTISSIIFAFSLNRKHFTEGEATRLEIVQSTKLPHYQK